MKALGWLLVLLCLWPWGGAPRSTAPTGARLLGPTTYLLSSALWVRFDALVREGRYEAAYDTAERALELDPRSPQGWMYYAAHLARARASGETERDPAARRRWTRAALDLLLRGEGLADQPGELALTAGLTLLLVAELEEQGQDLDWPGGPAAARAEAKQALDRAVAAGVDVLEASEALSGHEHSPSDEQTP